MTELTSSQALLIIPKEDVLSLLMESGAASSRITSIYDSHLARIDAEPSNDVAKEEIVSLCRSAASYYRDDATVTIFVRTGLRLGGLKLVQEAVSMMRTEVPDATLRLISLAGKEHRFAEMEPMSVPSTWHSCNIADKCTDSTTQCRSPQACSHSWTPFSISPIMITSPRRRMKLLS